jgi:hypothetical protein
LNFQKIHVKRNNEIYISKDNIYFKKLGISRTSLPTWAQTSNIFQLNTPYNLMYVKYNILESIQGQPFIQESKKIMILKLLRNYRPMVTNGDEA